MGTLFCALGGQKSKVLACTLVVRKISGPSFGLPEAVLGVRGGLAQGRGFTSRTMVAHRHATIG